VAFHVHPLIPDLPMIRTLYKVVYPYPYVELQEVIRVGVRRFVSGLAVSRMPNMCFCTFWLVSFRDLLTEPDMKHGRTLDRLGGLSCHWFKLCMSNLYSE